MRVPRIYKGAPLSSRPERSAVEGPAVSVPLTTDPVHNASTLRHLDRRSHGPVGPTQGDEKRLLFSNYSSRKSHLFPLSSRPKRSAVERSLCGCSYLEMFFDRNTRISYFAMLATTTYAVFFKENRMMLINATGSRQEIPGSGVERSAVQRSFRGNVFPAKHLIGTIKHASASYT
jgi:hypothetical protein